jgi:hypothetical protein
LVNTSSKLQFPSKPKYEGSQQQLMKENHQKDKIRQKRKINEANNGCQSQASKRKYSSKKGENLITPKTVDKDKHQNDNLHLKKKNQPSQKRFSKKRIKTKTFIKKRKPNNSKTVDKYKHQNNNIYQKKKNEGS